MTNTPDTPTTELPGHPPIVDLTTWQAARDALLVREKAHTREGWPEGRSACWSWRSDAHGNATWGPTSRPVPQWTRPGATPVEALD